MTGGANGRAKTSEPRGAPDWLTHALHKSPQRRRMSKSGETIDHDRWVDPAASDR
jgi:hypothetical protein